MVFIKFLLCWVKMEYFLVDSVFDGEIRKGWIKYK